MLTKQDLSQIKKVVRDEVTLEAKDTRTSLRSEIKLSRMEIQSDLNDLTDKAKDIDQRLTETQKDVSITKKDVKKIDKKLDFVIKFFDKKHVALEKRTERIETHLNIQPLADF